MSKKHFVNIEQKLTKIRVVCVHINKKLKKINTEAIITAKHEVYFVKLHENSCLR